MSNTRKLRKPAMPTCSCSHGRDPGHPCGRPARFRVTRICAVVGCTCAADSHLLCGDCVDQWLEWADSDPRAPELRVTAL